MRVLFLTTLLPGLRRTGSEVASQAFVDAIRGAGHDVTVLGYRRAGTDPPRANGDVAVAERHIETSAAGPRPALWMARAVATRQPYTLAKYVGRAYARAVDRALAVDPPDLVVLDHAQVGWLDRPNRWGAPLVYLAHNVEHRLHALRDGARGPRAWAHRREHRLLAPVERDLASRADETWTLTATDASALQDLGSGVRVRVFDLAPVTVPAPPGDPDRDVVLLGGWHWRPNAAGLRWFAERVAPHLEAHGLDIVVGGADGDAVLGPRHHLRAVGPVPEALPFLQGGRVVAVPSVEGAGVQVKTLDAIASGRWVVATPTAMRGIADPPPTVLVEDDPARFASALAAAASAPPNGEAALARAWAASRAERFAQAVRDALADLEGAR
jgi:polysaccharide biosynthesis protein PslH